MHRSCLLVLMLLAAPVPALAQAPQGQAPVASDDALPRVEIGIVSFLQYVAELEEADGFNAFDVTRGYLDVRAQLSPRVRARFTPNLRRVTDADLTESLAFGIEYAYVDVEMTPSASVVFGLQPTPWLAHEESLNRYRAQGPLFAERVGLIPGPGDFGASVRTTGDRVQVHAGVYNGEGYAQTELDKYKSLQGRVTFRPVEGDGLAGGVRVSGFYSHGWYAEDRPRDVAIVMGSFESRHVVATGQFAFATDNPFAAADITRRGMSFFGEARQGPTGWAGLGRVDLFDPDTSDDGDKRRRHIYGGAHWSQFGEARLGLVISVEQVYRETGQERLIENRLLVQTHLEF